MIGFQHTAIDSSMGAQTPEGIEYTLYPAGFPIRACAYAIDTLFQWAFISAAMIILSLLEAVLGFWLMLLILFGINWFYHVFCEILFKGQSLGKRIMGLRVVRGDGSPVNPGASFLRNLLRFADTFMFLYLIALIVIAASRGFRRIGDWAADTLVVYTANAQAPVWRPAAIREGVESIAPPRPLSYAEKQAVLMFARRCPLLGPARADEIAAAYAETLRAGEDRGSPAAYLLGIARRLSGEAAFPQNGASRDALP
jgi:uncharacterized RDD family membrane protein YckC